MSDAVNGQIALLHRAPNAIWEMSFYGFWRPTALQVQFTPDGKWAEVLRLAPHWRTGEGGLYGCWFEASRGSGAAINVGRSLRVMNRSALAAALNLNVTSIFATPVRGRRHLWHSLWNVSAADWPSHFKGVHDEASLRKRYFDIYPWRLEAKVDLCGPARRSGYDSIQIFHEICSMCVCPDQPSHAFNRSSQMLLQMPRTSVNVTPVLFPPPAPLGSAGI